ncbi:MAG TPA: right-handed parallel beta-helix repeat-containing protein [Candidatus Methanofastidiosa archaeon]|nr:right-handed parallel beta-helix repeat-containing protein [Candidatus Methanofastidiosa archaeon]
MVKSKLTISLLISIGIVLAMLPQIAAQCGPYDVVYVDDSSLGEAHFDTIQDAIDELNVGGTVYIGPGHYVISEPIEVLFDMTIIGTDPDEVFVDGNGTVTRVFDIWDANANLSGCSIFGSTSDGVAIRMIEECDVNVSGNAIYDNDGNGINVLIEPEDEGLDGNGDYGNTLEIDGNYIHSNGDDGINVECTSDGYESQYFAWLANRVWIRDNEIASNSDNGIDMYYTIYWYFYYVMIVDDDTITNYDYTSDIITSGNYIHDNGRHGIDSWMDVNLEYDAEVDTQQYNGVEVIVEVLFSAEGNEICDNAGYGIYSNADVEEILPEMGGNGEPVLFEFIESVAWFNKNMIIGNEMGGISVYGHSAMISNNLIKGNDMETPMDGKMPSAGILLTDCFSWILNNTVVYNYTGMQFYASESYIENNIVANNQVCGVVVEETGDLDGDDGYSYCYFSHNDIWGNFVNYQGWFDMTGTDGNISEDPIFCSEDNERLLTGSPCIDSGRSEVTILLEDDLVGYQRMMGSTVDMGCYEMPQTVWTPGWIQPLVLSASATANSLWETILGNLPPEINSELGALIDEVSALMAQAGSLSNPVYTNGVLERSTLWNRYWPCSERPFSFPIFFYIHFFIESSPTIMGKILESNCFLSTIQLMWGNLSGEK